MNTIVRVISFFIGLFVFANGVWIVWQLPYGDEPVGYAIIAIGIAIPIVAHYLGEISERRDA